MLFSEVVVKCQNLIRQFAYEQLKHFGKEESEANLCSTSCVSQRDIQVEFIFIDNNIVLLFHREYLHFMIGFLRHMSCYKCEL